MDREKGKNPVNPKKHPLRLSDLGERGWLDFLREILGNESRPSLLVPVGDDAAVVKTPPDRHLVITSDAMVEGTHFQKAWLGWAGLARRAVLAAASDITAMGGTPTGFLISLGVPASTRMEDLKTFGLALARLAKDLHLVALGGDTVRSRHILVDVTVLGTVSRNRVLRQTGAVSGDALWVTGGLGRSRAFLEQVLAGSAEARGCLDSPCFLPPVRWTLLESLRKAFKIRALTDLSDGLTLDLLKVLRGNNQGAEIFLDQIPVDPKLPPPLRGRAGVGGLGSFYRHESAFLGGEDYELLVVEAGDSRPEPVLDLEGVPLTRIGHVTESGSGITTFWKGKKRKVSQSPFLHFGHSTPSPGGRGGSR